jgi:uncharacterized protein (DUF1684 family)
LPHNRFMMLNRLTAWGMIAFFISLFSDIAAQVKPASYQTEIKEWDAKRLESLKSATGWVNLAGLYWLKPGENRFGKSKTNELVFDHPEFPDQLGSFVLTDKEVRWKTASGQTVLDKNSPVEETVIFQVEAGQPKSLAYKTFRWSIIKRENLIGVRFRDLANPALDKLQKIDRFKPTSKWVIKASFEPSLIPTILTTNILGQTYSQPHPGKVIFEIDGKKFVLDVVDEGDPDAYHIVFGDDTNGEESYASGRFLDIPKPDANGQTVIDFNKAYNPPCAFSEFSTCPIPTKANTLPIRILAGEKKVH